VADAARQAGFLVNAVQPDAVRLAPPLILDASQAAAFLGALPGILDEVPSPEVATAGGGPR
jgi:acetylornithine aminotransferase